MLSKTKRCLLILFLIGSINTHATQSDNDQSANKQPIVNTDGSRQYKVMEMVGKSDTEIADILDQPGSCKKTSQGESCYYQNKTIEVIYINGRADWFAFAEIEGVKFDHYAIHYLGLVPASPFVHRARQMHWQGHHGLGLISVYGSGEDVQLIQVRAYTLE